MNKLLLIWSICLTCSSVAFAETTDIQQTNSRVDELDAKVEQLVAESHGLRQEVSSLRRSNANLSNKIALLEAKGDSANSEIKAVVSSNMELANAHYEDASEKIQGIETSTESNIHELTVWGVWAIVALLVIAVLVYIVLHRRLSKNANVISAILNAQTKLEEESVKLDTKLVELLDKQLLIEAKQKADKPTPASVPVVDHSLALKVADEITRIEKNLSRMDASVKGYKPLLKAIERIKDNFKAYGYEIVTYLGQPYNENMRVNPEFEIDEEMPVGTRTITAVSKPQIHYNGELIQKATVTVTQNI